MTINEIPDGGFCLSAFLIVSRLGHAPDEVLMGRINPEGEWDKIGALDHQRALVHAKGWMLPSSHLIYGESPQEAGRRIMDEQLGVRMDTIVDPKMISDLYSPRTLQGVVLAPHWDLGFVFRVEISSEQELRPPTKAWNELRFFEKGDDLKSIQFARSHDDVLRSVGLLE